MKQQIQSQFSCTILDWGRPEDDLGTEVWSAVQNGRFIVADSLALLISELQSEMPGALILMAA